MAGAACQQKSRRLDGSDSALSTYFLSLAKESSKESANACQRAFAYARGGLVLCNAFFNLPTTPKPLFVNMRKRKWAERFVGQNSPTSGETYAAKSRFE